MATSTNTNFKIPTFMRYALDINECADLIARDGHEVTYLVQGEMGWGKSAILNILAEMDQFKNHALIYIECNTKADSGDFFTIKYSDDGNTFITIPHTELGLHLTKPVIVLFDEIGKMPRSALNAVLRILYQRAYGDMSLAAGSIVFGATNLAAEGLGDHIAAHVNNRVSVLTMRKPEPKVWLSWAIVNNIHQFVLTYANQTHRIFESFLTHDPRHCAENLPEVYDPRSPSGALAYVTGRSLERASHILYGHDAQVAALQASGDYDAYAAKRLNNMLYGALVGTVGEAAGADMMAMFALMDQLPTTEQIKANPDTAPVPTSGAARCLVVSRALNSLDRTWAAEWMTYLMRLDKPVQALFGLGTMAKGYPRLEAVARNSVYQQWALENRHMFGRA
jgi:hypothetical protein